MAYTPSLNGGRINATIGGNTAGVGSLVSTGTMTLVGGNNITLSQNANAITVSGASQSVQTVGMYATGNTTQNTSATLDARSMSLNGLGAMTVGYSGGSVQLSTPVVSSVSATGIINISSNGAVVSIGAPAFSMGMSTIGNTSGTSGTASNQVIFAGGNNVTLSQSTGVGGNTISIAAGAPAFSAGISNIGNTTGTSGTVSNQIIFAGGNNITLSQSTGAGGNTISIAGGGGFALANSQTVYSSGTASLNVAGGAMTIASSTNGASQSFNFSVPQTSSLSATGAVSISTNGGVISIGAPIATTLSRWEYPDDVFASLGVLPQGSLSIQHMYVPFNITGSAAKVGGSLSVGTSTANATGSAKMSLWMGLYTMNGSTLSLATSGSTNNAFSWQAASSVSSTSLSGVTGMRQLTVPMNVNMTPGEYWMAAVISSATTAPGASMTMYGNNQLNGAAGGAVLTPIGTNTTAARDVVLLQGVYTAATSAGPASIVGSQINNTAASIVQSANFYGAIFNATY
jgi:hypothetical protein